MNNKGGLTLFEIVLVITVLSIIAIFTFNFFYSYAKTYREMAIQRELHEEATYVLERITRELRDAKLMIKDDEPNFIPNHKIEGSDVLLFEKSHVTPKDSNRYVVFFLQNNEIRRASYSYMPSPPYGPGKPLSRNVLNFFVKYGQGHTSTQDHTFGIYLTLGNGTHTLSLTTTVSPKNSYGPPSYQYFFRGRHFHGNYEEVIY